MTSDTEILTFLRETPLLAGFEDAFTAELARQCRLRKLQKGEILFLQSDRADAAYLVRFRSISLFLTSLDGRDLVGNEMRPGDLFGELAITLPFRLTPNVSSAILTTVSN